MVRRKSVGFCYAQLQKCVVAICSFGTAYTKVYVLVYTAGVVVHLWYIHGPLKGHPLYRNVDAMNKNCQVRHNVPVFVVFFCIFNF